MILLEDRKAVLIRSRNPGQIKAVIPKAKSVMHSGKEYVAVPHQVEAMQVLRNLGIKVPSPILSYYGWPGRYKPFAHQKEIAEFLTMNNRAFNLCDIGTGKTLSTLWAFDYLKARGIVKKALVVTPLSTLERAWGDEVFQHFSHLNAAVLYGSRDKRLKMLNVDADIYLINHDGLKVRGLVEALAKRPDIDLIIVDEIAQAARNASTDRFKVLNTIINKQSPRRAWGLTGTPIPNQPTDAWAQCRLLTPERVPPYFNKFKDRVMRQVSQFVWLPREGALDVVQEVMQPAIRFHRDDCIDLPECQYVTRHAPLSDEQAKSYKEMLTKLCTEVDSGQVTAVNEAVKAQKLLQICTGTAYNANGDHLQLDATARFEAVSDAVEESNSKAIVFAPFVGMLDPLKAHLEGKGFSVGLIYGDVSKHERDVLFSGFQKGTHPQVLLATPSTMSHGLTLTAASTIVWAAPITSNDIFEQACGRITRPGQKHSQLIIMVEGSEIERKYYARLKEKKKVQGTFLELVKQNKENV